MANRTHANLSRFFSWCLERDRLDISPVANVKAPGVEVARDRILSDDEIEAVWRAWDTMGWPFGAAFKLLLLTGQRRDEVARLEWENVDFEGRLWTLPRTATKSNRLHEVPLSDVALEILAASPRTSQYIFSTNGTSPISGFSHAKRRCDDLSGIHNWRLHDLRRTAASGMARLGVAPHVVEKVLAHVGGTISGVAAVYNRHRYSEEKRCALGVWASKLREITEGPADNVVPLRR
jgi:integrase